MIVKPNKIERLKARLRPYDFFPEISSVDLINLTEEQRFYLRNFGIYNHKLSPDTFMLRVRITAGRISTDKLSEIRSMAQRYRLRMILTMRAQIELHGLEASNVLEVWKKLEIAGLTTWQTLTDNFRNIVTDPLDGESDASRIETYPLIKEMESLFLKNPDYVGTLPRKFNTAICGTAASSHSFFGNDLYFALAQKGETVGFNLYLGGKNSAMAQDADIFVERDEVVTLFDAVIQTYLHHGLRGTRSKTRLFHLLQSISISGFKTHLQSYYPNALQNAGILLTKKEMIKEFTPLKEGNYAFCYRSRFGEISSEELTVLCDYAAAKKLSIRIGIDQNLYLFGLEKPEAPFAKLSNPPRISVCAGSRYCPLSLFDMKEEAGLLPLERLERLGVSVGYSGCLKGCGKHQHVDIGLVGLRTAIYGPTQKSARLFLGGQYTNGKATARLTMMAVPLHGINDIIHVILDEFKQSGYLDFESFSKNILNYFSTDFLALWFLAKCYTQKSDSLKISGTPLLPHSTEEEQQIIERHFSELSLQYEEKQPFHGGIQKISQKLWGE